MGSLQMCDAADLIESGGVSGVAKPLSRKERKRLAAREHALHCGTLADAIVEVGVIGVESGALMQTPLAAFPFGIPCDVIENVLIMYLDFRSVRAMMMASPAFMHFMRANDHVFEGIYKRSRREFPGRFPSTKFGNPSWFERCKAAYYDKVDTRGLQKAYARLQRQDTRAQQRDAAFTHPNSEKVRALLRERTQGWPAEAVTMYVRVSDLRELEDPARLEAVLTKTPPTVVTEECDDFGRTCAVSRVLPCREVQLPKSVAHRQQYECAHWAVSFVVAKHQFRCRDCGLVIHAPKALKGVWQE